VGNLGRKRSEISLGLLLLVSVELTVYTVISVSIPQYDILRYPLGLIQQLPPVYWSAEISSVLTVLLASAFHGRLSERFYGYVIGMGYALMVFNGFFVFYFVNPVFILSRDELGHAAEVFTLLTNHNTVAVKGIYEADYPLAYLYGAFSYAASGLNPTFYFLYFSPMFYTIFQVLCVYAFIRLFLRSPYSEVGAVIYAFSSIPFYASEWSPQLMSYNLLFPIFLLMGMIVKKGGVKFLPLLMVFSTLTGLTDIATFTTSVIASLALIPSMRGLRALKSHRLFGYTAFTASTAYLYWVLFNPAAAGAIAGDLNLVSQFLNFLRYAFLPQTPSNLNLPSSQLISTFLPPSPYHFYSVASKLLEGGIFLLLSLASFAFLAWRGKANGDLRLLMIVGSTLLVAQGAVGLVNNVSNVLTRMIPQVMVFYTVIILQFLDHANALNSRAIKAFLLAGLTLNVPLSILGYTTIATTEHSSPAAFYAGEVLGRYGISSISTYDFYSTLYEYDGNLTPSLGLTSNHLEFAGPYVQVLSIYFNGPNLKGYDRYYNSILENGTVILNTGDLLVSAG